MKNHIYIGRNEIMLEFKDGKCVCGTVTVGERGQIVIPKKARDYFNVEAGDTLIMVGDMHNRTMTILKAETLSEFATTLKNLEEN